MSEIRTLLERAAGDVPAGAAPDDLWRRGRRRRRRDRLVAATVVVALVALAVWLPWTLLRAPRAVPPADPDAKVPAQVYVPWEWQESVDQSPPGDASVLLSGDGGLRGSDIFDHEGKVAVVGHGGAYRLLLYGGWEIMAGQEVMVSPTGRYAAQPGMFEGHGVEVVDLRTGEAKGYPAAARDGTGVPIAWSPDSRMVVSHESYGYDELEGMRHNGVSLTDLRSGRTRLLHPYVDGYQPRDGSIAAFSPDSRQVAVSDGDRLRLYDVSGRPRWSADLGGDTYLVGAGAFTPDGKRIAVATRHGCAQHCDTAGFAGRRWTFGYLDAATGKPAEGPELATVRAMAVRGLGWHGDRLVAVAYQPEEGIATPESGEPVADTDYWSIGGASLVAVDAGGATELIDTPDDVVGIDVPRELVEAGRFGGPSPRPAAFPARGEVLAVYVSPLFCVAVVLLLVVWPLVRNRRRRRAARTFAG